MEISETIVYIFTMLYLYIFPYGLWPEIKLDY